VLKKNLKIQNNTDMTQTIKTYDIVFNDSENSNSMGFRFTDNEAIQYIDSNNGTGRGYFADYKGGTVSAVCCETEEVIYEVEVI